MNTLYLNVWPDGPGASRGTLTFHGIAYRCSLGRSGVVAADAKREGDGCTPIGDWPVRFLYYRADRVDPPKGMVEARISREADGWCDASDDPQYNRPVSHPYPASAERIWREDALYDLVVVLGHNDAPPVPGLGSAIFLHVAPDNYRPTAGCVALERADLIRILDAIDGPAVLRVREGPDAF